MAVNEEIPRTVGEAEARLMELRDELDGQIAVLQVALGEVKAARAGVDRLKQEVARQ